jgi:hypothetical protein
MPTPRNPQRITRRAYGPQRATGRPTGRIARAYTVDAEGVEPPPEPDNAILAENSDFIMAENGDYIVQEA